jgi:pimeloyl-ACP methyl ester carboxylesterase
MTGIVEQRLDIRYADIAGYAMAYVEQGAGAPLVLVHGSLSDLRYWKPQIAALARSFRVCAVSLRGYWPGRPPGPGEFSVQRHVDDLAAFIAQIGGGRAHVVGHSRGGTVAFELARQHRGVVDKLVLADPGLFLAAGDGERGDFRQRAVERLRAGDVEGGLALFIDTVTGPDTWRRMVPWFKDMARDNAATLLGQVGEAPYRLQEDAARALDAPVLLVGGALSPPPYPAILETLARWLPHARRLDIAGSSHGMNLGHPRAFNEGLRQFLLDDDNRGG